MIGPRQVAETSGHGRVLRAKDALPDGEGALVQRLSLGRLALRLIEAREVVEGRRHVWVRSAQGLLQQREGALE